MKMNLPAMIALVATLSACSPSMRITPGAIPAVQPPPADLRVEAEQYVASYLSESDFPKITRGPELARLTKIVDRLTVAAGYPVKSFPLHLVDAGDQVNAAAFNGASIVVYLELMKRVPSDDELAAVLGHEVGHIVAAHYKDHEEEQKRATAVGVGSTLLGIAATVGAAAAGYGGGVADIAGDVTEGATGAVGYGAFVGSFSRTQEYEADHLGLLIMAKAGYDPEAAVRFWGNADQVFGSSTSTASSFFSTHPASEDRQTAIAEALPFARKYYQEALGK